jgi:hypothetical protein
MDFQCDKVSRSRFKYLLEEEGLCSDHEDDDNRLDDALLLFGKQ